MSANNFWDERFKADEFIYGKKPNEFIRDCFLKLGKPGLAYFPGEGEGRNAVFAASKGWECTAMDGSLEAKMKCERLARENKVNVRYIVSDLLDQEKLEGNLFNVIAFSFVHFDSIRRVEFHRSLAALLKKGGQLFFEVFSKEQINYNSGGPPNIDMLYTANDLASDFKSLKILKNDKMLITLNEGPFHQGPASVIRFHAVKE